MRLSATVLLLWMSACSEGSGDTDRVPEPNDPFVELDTDKSGTISRAEWQRKADVEAKRLPPGETPDQHQRDRAELFRYLDKNGDGEVIRQEWDIDRAG